MLRRIGQALTVVGVLGFFGAFCLQYAGTWLDGVELPIVFETNIIALPDGGRLTATMPTARVQRYGDDGRFRNGWFVDAKGGHFAIGLTRDGKVAVCTGRGRQIFLFDPDRRPAGHQACFGAPREVPRILQPADFPAGEVNLQPVLAAERPIASQVSVLLLPFWHPFVALLIGLAGTLVLRFDRSVARQSS